MPGRRGRGEIDAGYRRARHEEAAFVLHGAPRGLFCGTVRAHAATPPPERPEGAKQGGQRDRVRVRANPCTSQLETDVSACRKEGSP